MIIRLKSMFAFGMIVAIYSSAWAQAAPSSPFWIVNSAPARFTVALQGSPARISSVDLYLPDPKWVDMPIRVFTDGGIPVGSDLVWPLHNEPVTLVFDSSSGATSYQVYVGSNLPALHLPDTKAGVWLESRPGNPEAILNLPAMLRAWKQSKTVNSRAVMTGIYEGGDRFGQLTNTLERFQGWFDAPEPEHLELMTGSNGASFVLIDGTEVVEWAGHHDFKQKDHHAGIDLQRGPHLLEYYDAVADRDTMVSWLAVKGGPFSDWKMLMPHNRFFRPISTGTIVNYEVQNALLAGYGSDPTPSFEIEWSVAGQTAVEVKLSGENMLDPYYTTDFGLVSMQLTARPANGTLTWTFDDGETATGAQVTHLFLRPGLRVVKLSGRDGARDLGSTTLPINVQFDRKLWGSEPEFTDPFQADVMGRDPAALSASDLASCLAVCNAFENERVLLKLLPAACAQMKKFSEPDMAQVTAAALFLARDLTHLTEALSFLHAIVDRGEAEKTSPEQADWATQAELALGQLILDTSDQTGDVRSLIQELAPQSLKNDEADKFALLRADFDLATGDTAEATRLYQAQTDELSGPNARDSIRYIGLVGQARAFLEKKDYESAETALDEAGTMAPVSRLSPDWEITRLRLYQAEGFPRLAYIWAKRFLPVMTGSDRSELLFWLTDLAFSQGDPDLAHKTLAELLKNYPYSLEAAEAKQKWPGQD